MILDGKRWITYPSRLDVIKVWAIGDIHYGNVGCDLALLKTQIAQIAADPYSFWIGMGDYAEFIPPGDKRFDSKSVTRELRLCDLGNLGKVLMTRIKELFWPIRHKCLGLLFGNHEDRYMIGREQEDLHAWLCTELGVRNLTYCACFDIVTLRNPNVKRPRWALSCPDATHTRFTTRVFAHHGTGASRTEGGKTNTLSGAMDAHSADLYLLAHLHGERVLSLASLGADKACRKQRPIMKLGLITGVYLRTYSTLGTTYGEKRLYRPVSLGASRVEILPERREISAETVVRI